RGKAYGLSARVHSCQSHQVIAQNPRPFGCVKDRTQCLAVFGIVAVPPKRKLGGGSYERGGSAKLVRGVGGELRDPLEGSLKAIHHLVEGFSKPLQLVS